MLITTVENCELILAVLILLEGKKTTIEINAKIYKGVVEDLHITNRIRGKL